MKIDIYIRERNGSREIRIPWLPEKINYSSGGVIKATYDIMNKGPVEVQTGTGLSQYEWESEFPGSGRQNDTSMMRGEWKNPEVYHRLLEDWRSKGTPLKLMVTGYPINKDVTLDDYTGEASGGFGDWIYSLIFVEDRDIVITSSKVEEPKTERPAAEKSTSYTIKKGDNLWKIAQNLLGAGSKWRTIYEANKEIIESTAKKYGKSSSNNGWWIYPGVTLTIPGK